MDYSLFEDLDVMARLHKATGDPGPPIRAPTIAVLLVIVFDNVSTAAPPRVFN
jgi:hypothetical protein